MTLKIALITILVAFSAVTLAHWDSKSAEAKIKSIKTRLDDSKALLDKIEKGAFHETDFSDGNETFPIPTEVTNSSEPHRRAKRGRTDIGTMLAGWNGCLNPSILKSHGCWCGDLLGRYNNRCNFIVDSIDRCCYWHDRCYVNVRSSPSSYLSLRLVPIPIQSLLATRE